MDITKYMSFLGRSTRSEYWAINVASYILLLVLTSLVIFSGITNIVGIILATGLLICGVGLSSWAILTVTARRCRDAGINPWWAAALFVPYVGVVPWIVFGCLSTYQGEVDG